MFDRLADANCWYIDDWKYCLIEFFFAWRMNFPFAWWKIPVTHSHGNSEILDKTTAFSKFRKNVRVLKDIPQINWFQNASSNLESLVCLLMWENLDFSSLAEFWLCKPPFSVQTEQQAIKQLSNKKMTKSARVSTSGQFWNVIWWCVWRKLFGFSIFCSLNIA